MSRKPVKAKRKPATKAAPTTTPPAAAAPAARPTADTVTTLLGHDFDKAGGTILKTACVLAAELATRPARQDEIEVAVSLAALLVAWSKAGINHAVVGA